MSGAQLSASVAGRTIRTAAAGCVALAAAALIVLVLIGRPLPGIALAVGLLLGATNGLLAGRLVTLPVPFIASSLARLLTFSMVGVAIGFALGTANIWLVLLGLAAAQFVLAASAVRTLVSP